MPNKTKKPQDSKFLPYEHLDKIGETSVYYGFTPRKGPAITKADIDAAKDIMDGDDIDDETEKHGRLPLHAEEKIALIRTYHDAGWHAEPQPIMLYFKDAFRGSIKKNGY